MLRHWETVSPEEREKYRERGRVVGRMVAARMTAEDKAAFAALVRTPEARARNVDALAKRNAKRFAEDPDWLKRIMREKWSRHDPATEAQRKKRSENSRRMVASWSPEQRAAFREAARKACSKPIEGRPKNGEGEVLRFESVTAAAKFFAEGTDFISMRRKRSVIYHAVSGYRRSAFGYTWQYV